MKDFSYRDHSEDAVEESKLVESRGLRKQTDGSLYQIEYQASRFLDSSNGGVIFQTKNIKKGESNCKMGFVILETSSF